MAVTVIESEAAKAGALADVPDDEVTRPLWQNVLLFAAMIGVLVFANWGRPDEAAGIWYAVYQWKWALTGACAVGLAAVLVAWFGVQWWRMALAAAPVAVVAALVPDDPRAPFAAGSVTFSLAIASEGGESRAWFDSSWGFAKQILPLLLIGVMIAGLLLGRPGHEGLIPAAWVEQLVGGNSLRANGVAAVLGAFMYFATLTEVPILEGLIGNGMGQGPALALLLAGPALSLPNMLVVASVIGWRKALAFVCLAVAMATVSGLLYGRFFA
jgi:uncharacterized membrane protein YraQ (UPF0718 family)